MMLFIFKVRKSTLAHTSDILLCIVSSPMLLQVFAGQDRYWVDAISVNYLDLLLLFSVICSRWQLLLVRVMGCDSYLSTGFVGLDRDIEVARRMLFLSLFVLFL